MLYPHRYIALNVSFNSISFDYEIMNVNAEMLHEHHAFVSLDDLKEL